MKSVFVYTTAGDAGLGIGPPTNLFSQPGGRREAAVRFIANLDSLPAHGALGMAQVNGHAIATYTYKNVISYFLRLPDGNGWAQAIVDRLGFVGETTAGPRPTLSAVDGSATYIGWNDSWTL